MRSLRVTLLVAVALVVVLAAPTESIGKSGATVPAKFACRTNADCINSCYFGAVNRSWHKTHGAADQTCQDGCASAFMAAPRCVSGACVAYSFRGKPVPGCTRQDRNPPQKK